MTKIGLAIPNGIIVTTDACREYFKNGKKISEELRKEILDKLETIQKKPLLVSVRSGAPISMPGMMDTILNVGFNDKVAEEMLASIRDEKFVYSSYARFISMFSDRKSTRLNSSHANISYAVFCLKKKKSSNGG